MAEITICSDFGAQRNKVWHCFHCLPSISHEVMGEDAMILVFWMLSFKPTFSLSSFTFIKRLFSSSSLSAIRVVSSAYCYDYSNYRLTEIINIFITSGPYKQEHDCCCYSVTKSWSTLCIPMNCSTLGCSVLHYLPEFAQTHVHWVSDAIQPSHPLSSPFPPAFNLS